MGTGAKVALVATLIVMVVVVAKLVQNSGDDSPTEPSKELETAKNGAKSSSQPKKTRKVDVSSNTRRPRLAGGSSNRTTTSAPRSYQRPSTNTSASGTRATSGARTSTPSTRSARSSTTTSQATTTSSPSPTTTSPAARPSSSSQRSGRNSLGALNATPTSRPSASTTSSTPTTTTSSTTPSKDDARDTIRLRPAPRSSALTSESRLTPPTGSSGPIQSRARPLPGPGARPASRSAITPAPGPTPSSRVSANLGKKFPVEHKVVAGDTIYELSKSYYGTYRHFKFLERANNNPKLLVPGMTITIPTPPESPVATAPPSTTLATRSSQSTAPTAPSSTSSNPAPRADTELTADGKFILYTVRKGDSLTAISKRFYKDAAKFDRIRRANRELYYDVLRAGQKIKIPR